MSISQFRSDCFNSNRRNQRLHTDDPVPGCVAVPALLVAALLASGCSMQAVETRASFPAKVRYMRTPRLVHVSSVTVDGDQAPALRTRLDGALRRSGFHQIAGSGAAVHVTAAGRTNFSADPRKSVARKCVSRDRKGRCTKTVKVARYDLVERCTVYFEVVGRSGDYASAPLLFRAHSERRLQKTQWKNGEPPPSARGELCTRARSLAFTEAVQVIAPQTRSVSVTFNKLSGHSATEQAINAVRASDFASAERLFKSALNSGLSQEQNGWAHYNLGVLYYLTGRFQSCATEMDTAQARTGTTSHIGAIRARCLEYDR